MISMVILAVGLLALSSMQGTFAEGNSRSRQLTVASDMASDRIMELYSTDYEEMSTGTDVAHKEKNGRDYEINSTVSSFPSMNNARQVQVTVTWEDQGRDHSISFDWIKGNATMGN